MIPRRYVIAGLGIGLAIVLAVVLRPNRSDDGNQAAEPVANVATGESSEPNDDAEDPHERAHCSRGVPKVLQAGSVQQLLKIHIYPWP